MKILKILIVRFEQIMKMIEDEKNLSSQMFGKEEKNMSVNVETVGYKFRVKQGTNVFDIISTTELGMTKSNGIIRAFFDNFKVLKIERNINPEVVTADDGKNVNIASDKLPEVEKGSGLVKPARGHREMTKDLWGNLRDLLSEEFTIAEYTKALSDAGYEYTKSSWEAVPAQQLKRIVKLGKIEKIEGSKPVKYRKIMVPHSFRSDQAAERTLKSLRAGEKVLFGTIQ